MEKNYPNKLLLVLSSLCLLLSARSFSQVTVTATGGVTTANYTTLRAAFNAVNAGTHTGTITIGISANTTETAPCVLNGSGAGSASYTSLAIAPTADGVMISGVTVAGRGVIELNGADNVTIDGDNASTTGINRNLTIRNTAANTVTFTSCVRLATSTLITSCDNVTIKNLNLSGSGTGRNTGAYTTEVTTWGIIASGAASVTAATTAPSPLTGYAILVPSGQTLSNLSITNNNIQTVSRGISINGSSTTVAPGLIISSNTIGNATAGAADQVTGIGITAQGSANGVISKNIIRVEGFIASLNTNRGINVGLISTAGVSGMTIEKNTIERNYNNHVKTHSASGIDVSGGNNHVIRNNFVGQCMNNQTAGTSAFNTTNCVAGIKITGGTGHKVYQNTVHLAGMITGTTGKDILAAFMVTSTACTGMDVRNNIFSNQITGGNPTGLNTVIAALFLPSGATNTMNLVLNNNTYYQTSGSHNGIAQVGTTASAANLYSAANFNAGATSPANNLRAYTSLLNVSGTNDASSYASANGTPVISAMDLHISFASPELSNVDQKGDPAVGLSDDIDGDVRPNAGTTNPDIGADEVTVPACIAASGGTISPASISSCVGQTVTLTSIGATNALGIVYQWKVSSTSGGPYSNVSGGTGANTSSYTTGTLSTGTNYYVLQTTCTFGPTTGYSNEVTVVTNALPTVTVSGTTTFCAGSSTTLTATGAGAGTYQWYADDSLIAGATSSTYAAAAAGYYNVIRTNAAGCSDSAATGITTIMNALPTVTYSVSPASATLCAGGSATLTGSGASTYSWTGGISNGAAFTPSSTTTYTLTGTDGNGCSNTASATITVNALPTIGVTTVPASGNVCSGSSATLTGSGASTYTWTGGVSNGVAFTPASSGSYTVTGTDANGCVNTATTTLTVNARPTVGTTRTPASGTMCVGGSATLSGTGASTYTWTGGVTNAVPFTPAGSATYTVTGTDANGCTNTATTTMTVYSLPTIGVTRVPSSGAVCTGGSATLSGTGATSYSWTGGISNGVSFTPASTGTYTVTGTDTHGCVNTASTTVTVNTLPAVTANASAAAVCAGSPETLSGGGATTYSWTGGVSNGVAFTPSSTATYTVTGTDTHGCVNTATTTVSVNALPTVRTSVAPASGTVCAGSSLTLNGSGASTYTWTGGVSDGVSFAPSSSGTYTVTGTDANGCSNTATASVIVNALPAIGVSSTPASGTVCEGSSATLNGSGAVSYSWTGGISNGVAFIPASTTTYTVTGTNAQGCTNTATATITVNTAPVVTASASAASVCAGSPETLSGGGASSYAWDHGVSDGVAFIPSATTTYNVTGIDANGCTNTASVTVNVNALPTVNANASAMAVCAGSPEALTGSGASTYTWDSGISDGIPFTPTSTTTYNVTGTDVNGCSNTASVTITVNPLPAVTANASAGILCEGSAETLTGGGAASYTWDNGVTDGVAFNVIATTTYNVTGMDVNGCTGTASVTVSVNAAPLVTANASALSLCAGDAEILTGSGATSYSWDNSVTDGVAFIPASTTTYNVTGTDANGCTSTAAVTVTVNPLPTVTANASAASVCAGSSETLTGGGAASYVWDNGVSDGVSFVPAATATYNVTGTDINGCVNTASVTIPVNSLPTVTASASASIVCSGSPETLNGSGASTYTWDNGVSDGISFGPTATTTYHVTGMDVNGCSNTDSITINVNALPAVSFSAFTTPVCDNAPAFALSGGSPAGGMYSGAGVSGGMFDPAAAGAGLYTITYTVSDSNSCSNSNTASISVSLCTKVNEVAEADEISIFPNPATDQFSISVSNAAAADVTVEVMDAQGKLVYRSLDTNKIAYRKNVNTESFAKGIYFVKVSVNGAPTLLKLVKQ